MLWICGHSFQIPGLQIAAYAIAGFGCVNFLFTVFGLYCMYGHPSRRYYERLLQLGKVSQDATIADVHVGTYRATWNVAEFLPRAQIFSVDIWDETCVDGERALWDVRRLEAPTRESHERVVFEKGSYEKLPLEDASVDALTLGFGTHEVPVEKRDALFRELRRVLRQGGGVLMYERGWNVPNYFVFGPGMFHFTRTRDWLLLLERHFGSVTTERSVGFVDLFVVRNDGLDTVPQGCEKQPQACGVVE